MCNAAAPQGREKMKKKGAFIVIEGLDGCGKTTQTKLLVEKLQENHDAIYTAEPSQGSIGVFIRTSILYREKRLPSAVEALLFAADRVDHVQNEVLPAMRQGKLVVSDRYLYSSLAYQGATGLSVDWIQRINEHALRPDLAIFIDVDPETVMRRLKPEKSVMEKLETQRKVREIYLQFVEDGDLVRIDGNKPKKAVAQELHATVQKFLSGSH
jgi:dTMP kinase